MTLNREAEDLYCRCLHNFSVSKLLEFVTLCRPTFWGSGSIRLYLCYLGSATGAPPKSRAAEPPPFLLPFAYTTVSAGKTTFLFFLFQGAQFPIKDQSNATFPVRSLGLSHSASELLLLGDPLVMWSSGWEGGRGLAVELKGRCVTMAGLCVIATKALGPVQCPARDLCPTWAVRFLRAQ